MEFSPDFATIMHGSIVALDAVGAQRRTDSFGSELRYINLQLLDPRAYPTSAACACPRSKREEPLSGAHWP